MHVVHVPARVTVNESYQLAKISAEAEQSDQDVTFDCSDTTMFGPFGVGIVAASAAVCRANGHEVSFFAPTDENAAGFAEEVGLDRFIQGRAVNGNAD